MQWLKANWLTLAIGFLGGSVFDWLQWFGVERTNAADHLGPVVRVAAGIVGAALVWLACRVAAPRVRVLAASWRAFRSAGDLSRAAFQPYTDGAHAVDLVLHGRYTPSPPIIGEGAWLSDEPVTFSVVEVWACMPRWERSEDGQRGVSCALELLGSDEAETPLVQVELNAFGMGVVSQHSKPLTDPARVCEPGEWGVLRVRRRTDAGGWEAAIGDKETVVGRWDMSVPERVRVRVTMWHKGSDGPGEAWFRNPRIVA